jgi:hypothetical protein
VNLRPEADAPAEQAPRSLAGGPITGEAQFKRLPKASIGAHRTMDEQRLASRHSVAGKVSAVFIKVPESNEILLHGALISPFEACRISTSHHISNVSLNIVLIGNQRNVQMTQTSEQSIHGDSWYHDDCIKLSWMFNHLNPEISGELL